MGVTSTDWLEEQLSELLEDFCGPDERDWPEQRKKFIEVVGQALERLKSSE